MPVDYMHNLLLGVVKSYFENLFMEKCKKFWVDEDATPEDLQKAIDERLLIIKPPTCINRTPRTMKDWANWKANEWRTFELFYALPCLTGILKKEYVEHLALLSVGSCILLQKSVSESDAHYVHRLFQIFCVKYQKYFGEDFMYYNIHLLIHVIPGVLRWGPLFTHNAFMFESHNRNLLQLKKNPHRVVEEVSKRYVILQALPKMLDRFATENQSLARFMVPGSWALQGVGTIEDKLTDDETTLLVNHYHPLEICLYYQRILYKGKRITTSQYAAKRKKNDDSVICLNGEEIVEVRAIFTLADQTVRLLTRQLLMKDCDIVSNPHLRHLSELARYGDLKIIKPQEISGQCIFIKTVTGTFLSKMPYGCY
ncbi:hypothetical protein FOCC_FOCC017007, partial [Frankliniella occidentalis]